ncbi:hypothetical protein JW835_06935 [bacterium]|nr:hypothetical protein [bacterium]
MNANQKKKRRTKSKKQAILWMTDFAKKKLDGYASIANRDEFMVILLGQKNNKDVVADVFLLYDQTIGCGSVKVSGRGINQSLWELQDKYPEEKWEILGWSHGHGDMDVFHSSIDDENTREIFLEQLAPVRMVVKNLVSQMELSMCDNNPYMYTDNRGSYLKFTDLTQKSLPATIKMEKHTPFYTGWIFSLVTNAKHQYYAERFSKHWCKECNRVVIKQTQMTVKFLKTPSSWKLDLSDLEREFYEKTERYRMGISYGNWNIHYMVGNQRGKSGSENIPMSCDNENSLIDLSSCDGCYRFSYLKGDKNGQAPSSEDH